MKVELANNFEEILITFNKNKVDYMIAGGYAVIFHGYGRTTGDLDIWVKPSKENKVKLITAFKELKYPSELLNHFRDIDFSKPFAVKLGKEPIQVDIFNAITGIKYEDAEKKCIAFKYSENLQVHFIHLYDLITNKMLTGRLKDAADVEELQKINMYNKDKSIVSFLKNLFKQKK